LCANDKSFDLDPKAWLLLFALLLRIISFMSPPEEEAANQQTKFHGKKDFDYAAARPQLRRSSSSVSHPRCPQSTTSADVVSLSMLHSTPPQAFNSSHGNPINLDE
jgi:hypothetical protein